MPKDKDFGFAEAMSDDPPSAAKSQAPGSLDLSGFEDAPKPPVDRKAAEVAREVGQAHGFTSRAARSPRSSQAAPKAGRPRKGRVRMAELVAAPPEARADEDRTQLNINTPVSIALRFKERERRLGQRAWQVLEGLLDQADAAERTRK